MSSSRAPDKCRGLGDVQLAGHWQDDDASRNGSFKRRAAHVQGDGPGDGAGWAARFRDSIK